MFKRFLVTVAVTATAAVAFAASTSASASQEVTIQTAKAPGPVAGTFAATGAFSDSGAINNLSIRFSALGAPDFGITHSRSYSPVTTGRSHSRRR